MKRWCAVPAHHQVVCLSLHSEACKEEAALGERLLEKGEMIEQASQASPEMKKEVSGNRLGPERKFFSVPVSYCCKTSTSKLSHLKHSIPFVSPVYMEAGEFCFLDQAWLITVRFAQTSVVGC